MLSMLKNTYASVKKTLETTTNPITYIQCDAQLTLLTNIIQFAEAEEKKIKEKPEV